VAVIIGMRSSNVNRMLRMVSEGRKKMFNYDVSAPTSGKSRSRGENPVRRAWFIDEEAFYEILMRSDKPISRILRRELSKILKKIRRSGYLASEEKLIELSDAFRTEMAIAITQYGVDPKVALRYFQYLEEGYSEEEEALAKLD